MKWTNGLRSVSIIGMFLFITIVLTGCWDKKNIQDINYVAALGIDYVNNKYVVYSQSLDFTIVAKQEGAKAKEHVPVWIGRGEGETLDSAVNDIFTAAQLPIIWEHISAIVFHERALKQDLRKMTDTLLRYHEIRFMPWVYGTRESLKELFAAPNTFNLSPVNSILHQPEDVYMQQSYIQPMTLREMFIHWLRPGSTLLLPSISITKDHWFEDIKPREAYQIDGIFAMENDHFHGWWGKKEISGLRWAIKNVVHTALQIEPHKKTVAMISLNVPESNIKVKLVGQEQTPKITIRIYIDGSIEETLTEMSPHKMELLAEEKIRSEVQKTFRDGLQKNVDLFSLRSEIYQQHVKYWNRHQKGETIRLHPDMINQVDVRVKLKDAGMVKLRR
ncbi:Ger(x)C family spore germination protein [Paenibacillus guangzhouensis]|uniref:Ger(x)C family spore germination protein n=1 Tax=Paenibacillus guangzhouensis TaxID=1473112 RepID=UPI001266AE32|nr:Ger(x)C family spore germination protein [Paenibacillus guangzhouensis]